MWSCGWESGCLPNVCFTRNHPPSPPPSAPPPQPRTHVQQHSTHTAAKRGRAAHLGRRRADARDVLRRGARVGERRPDAAAADLLEYEGAHRGGAGVLPDCAFDCLVFIKRGVRGVTGWCPDEGLRER